VVRARVDARIVALRAIGVIEFLAGGAVGGERRRGRQDCISQFSANPTPAGRVSLSETRTSGPSRTSLTGHELPFPNVRSALTARGPDGIVADATSPRLRLELVEEGRDRGTPKRDVGVDQEVAVRAGSSGLDELGITPA